jgi:hypothetical protein
MTDVKTYGSQVGAELLHSGIYQSWLQRGGCRSSLHLDTREGYLLSYAVV